MDKIVCVGKNYAEHAKELGDAIPEKPVLFLKPPSVLRQVKNNQTLPLTLPPNSGLVHHECEVVLKLKSGGYRLTLEKSRAAIGWVSVGLDMTLREKQSQLKKAGSPWTVAKVFPDAAVVGEWVAVADFPNYLVEKFSIAVNGSVRQEDKASSMILDPATCVAYISEQFPLCEGDLIFTGTPKGVNAIVAGDSAVLQFGTLSYTVHWNAYRQ